MIETEVRDYDNNRRQLAAEKIREDLKYGGAIAHKAIKNVPGGKKTDSTH